MHPGSLPEPRHEVWHALAFKTTFHAAMAVEWSLQRKNHLQDALLQNAGVAVAWTLVAVMTRILTI